MIYIRFLFKGIFQRLKTRKNGLERGGGYKCEFFSSLSYILEDFGMYGFFFKIYKPEEVGLKERKEKTIDNK